MKRAFYLGIKIPLIIGSPDPIPGVLVSEVKNIPISFKRINRGDRVVWSDKANSDKEPVRSFEHRAFHQGADVMPRTLLFHEISPLPSLSRPDSMECKNQ